MKQPLLFSNNGVMKMESVYDPEMQKRFDQACVDYVAETFTSFHALERLDIILEAVGRDKKVKVRTDRTISRHTVQRADTMKQNLYNIIASHGSKPGGVAMTTDAWTNKSLQSFLSLTVHIINDDMEMMSFVPFVQYMEGEQHTGENILLRLENFLERLGLNREDLRKFNSMDNASNNKKCVRINNKLFIANWCGNHTLALSVSDLFKIKKVVYCPNVQIKEILRKCQKIAVFVRKSEQQKEELVEACKTMDVPFIIPVLANKTRWNSCYENIESNLKLKQPLLYLSNNDKSKDQKWRTRVLSLVEFEAAEGINKALECIKKTTKLWETETSPTLHMVVRELINIRAVLKRLCRDENEGVREFASKLLKSVERRFKNCGTKNIYYCMGNFLDPRYQGCLLEKFQGRFKAAKDEIMNICSKYDVDIQTNSDMATGGEENSSDDDNDISEADRLRLSKRRRLSGDRDASSQGSEPQISKAEKEINDYQQMEVRF